MKTLIVVLSTLTLIACSGEETKDEKYITVERDPKAVEKIEETRQDKEELKNGGIKCENIMESGKKQGYWCIWGEMYPDSGYYYDSKIEEGPYVNDLKEGTWIVYYKMPNRIHYQETYKKGIKHGVTVEYDTNALPIQELEYDKGSVVKSTKLDE